MLRVGRGAGALGLVWTIVLLAPAAASARVGGPGDARAVTLVAGMNDPRDPNIVVNEFLPATITVRTGTSVTWSMAGPEPHSVTFVPPGAPPPSLASDQSLILPTPPSGPYAGASMVNSGVLPLGKDAAWFSMSFATPGRYTYYCVVHPQMTGTVTVTEDEQQSQAEIDRSGGRARARFLAEGRRAKARLAASRPAAVEHADGTTTYRVTTGASTAHTEVLAFAPTPRAVRPGDHVTFVNDSAAPHTASFGGSLVPANPTSDDVLQPRPGPSPQPLVADRYVNTGWLPERSPSTPESARSYTVDVPNPGTYSYVCVLHVGSGMVGQIVATR